MDDRPPEVEEWIDQWTPAQQEQVRWFADRVHAADERVAEAVKWRRLTFTVEDNWHHWLCAVSVTGRGVGLMLHKGALLDDPQRVFEGAGRYLRTIPFAVAVARPDAVTAAVRQAIVHQTEMLPER